MSHARKIERPAVSLEGFYNLIAADLARADALILRKVENEVPLITEVARHIIASGGKRIRPALTLISARLLGYEGERHIALAATVEFLHTATLLHDDVVDESKLRRGLTTANEVWGNKASVLVGDFLLGQAFQMMVGDGSLDVLDVLSSAAAIIAKGEVMQLMTQNELATTREHYLKVISAKTAALFAAACEVGPIIADQPQHRASLRAYGENIGIAFQLVDDALDYAADQQKLGKTVGDDFREGKVSLPVLLAYEKGNAEEREFWQRAIGQHRQEEADLAQALALMSRHQAILKTLALAGDYCARAKEALAPFPPSREKAAMLEIVDFCAARGY